MSVGGAAAYGRCGELGRYAVGGDDDGGESRGADFCGGLCAAWRGALCWGQGGEGWVDGGEGVIGGDWYNAESRCRKGSD